MMRAAGLALCGAADGLGGGEGTKPAPSPLDPESNAGRRRSRLCMCPVVCRTPPEAGRRRERRLNLVAALLLSAVGVAAESPEPDPFKQEPELQRFMANPTVTGFSDLRRHYRRQIELLGTPRLVALERSQRASLFLDVIEVYFPELLPRDFPGRLAYLSCYVELYRLSNDLTDAELYEDYEGCMQYEYAGYLPRHHLSLLEALEQLTKSERVRCTRIAP